MKERDLGDPAMGGWRSGIRNYFLDEVKSELGRKRVNQTKGGRNHHLQKCRAVGLGFQRAALSGQRVRQEGGAKRRED